MVFRIYSDEDLVYDPYLVHNGHNVLSPKLTVELNKSGSLQFVLPIDNECYNSIQKLTSIIRVYLDDTLLFKGRVMYDERDFYNRKQIYCEGALSFLLDSQMRPYDITCDPETFLSLVLDNHNAYVDQDKWIEAGEVTVLGAGDINHVSTDYANSMDVLTKELVEKYAGYLRIREEEDDILGHITYLDYLSAYETVCPQAIEFGKNLLDLKEHISAEDVFTVLIPLGERQKDGEGEVTGRLTIEEVNHGLDYLENAAGIALFGRIEKTQIWDDITTAQGLLENAQVLLDSGVNTATEITIKAVDLHMTDSEISQFELGNLVRVVSAPHSLDTQFQVTKIEYDIASPDQTTYTFSSDFGAQPTTPVENSSVEEQSLNPQVLRGPILRDAPQETEYRGYYALDRKTKKTSTLSEKIVRERKNTEIVSQNVEISHNESLASARASVAEKLNNGIGGYVFIKPDEIYIMNTDSVDTATKAWRWNQNGLGFWSGNAGDLLNASSYVTAMTSDGEIIGELIKADTIEANTFKTPDGTTFTDWLTKINAALTFATSTSNKMNVGDVNIYGVNNTITFGVSGGWMRLYIVPPASTHSDVHGNGNVFLKLHDNASQNSTVVFLDSNSTTVKYDTFSDPQ